MTTEDTYLKQMVSTTLIDQMPGMYYRCKVGYAVKFILLSEGCFVLTGYQTADLLLNTKISYRNLIHPDDKSMVFPKFDIVPGERYQFNEEYRIICADGITKWVNEVASGVYSKNNSLKYIEGYVWDISCEKNMLINAEMPTQL